MLREIALSQGVLAPAAEANAPEDDTVDTHAKMQYQFLGFNVCKLGLAELLGVGWNPRLTTLLKAVLQNRRSAPLDKRFMSRPLNDPRPVYSEVVSHLQTLYDSVAETLPFDQPEQEHVDDDFTAYNVAPTNSEQLRYLPPGSMYESWRQYRAVSNSTCSWQCFSKAWKEEFGHKLTFRNKYTFGICTTCVKHKLMLRHLGCDATSRLRQRHLYDRHLQAQYADRKVYWQNRSSSRSHYNIITVVVDAIDQAKFSVPKSPLFNDHLFQQFVRPRLHVWGILVHGWGAYIAVADADTSKGGGTLVDLLVFVLSKLRSKGCPLDKFDFCVQLDNTSSCNKNNVTLAFAACCQTTFFCPLMLPSCGAYTRGLVRLGARLAATDYNEA